MADPATSELLRRLVLSAIELRQMNPDWTDAMIEDYLNILDDLITLANGIDGKADLVPGDQDNIAVLIGDGNLQDSGESIFDVLFEGDVLGTANQIIVTNNGNGTVTLSTPQDIDTDADVTFDTVTLDKVVFNLGAGLSPAEGERTWDEDSGTTVLGLPGGNVFLQDGQELLAPRAQATGSNINNGDLVYVSGATGAVPEMALAKADAIGTSKGTIAMATEDIAQNQQGYYTAFGLVRGVNTSAYSPGDQLWLSATTAGGYTGTEPTRPNFSVKVGIVIRAHATEGVIFVNIKDRSILGLQQDSEKILFGTGSDVSMYYDGTDFY
ncbi:MAG: hypothetical protein GWN13_00675, partial [Phycisphaerae bacterium]|nr:hypothetical protein [Phycisphaerae bacterium]NIW96766.1 hypothetical protein [Phycisphaerae bacterium]